MRSADLPAFLDGLGPEWLGLSLTMPLKRAVMPLVAGRDALVERLGLANTLLLGERPRLFNTDVAGVAAVLGSGPYRRAVVLGAGATAASSLEALRRLGVPERTVAAARSGSRRGGARRSRDGVRRARRRAARHGRRRGLDAARRTRARASPVPADVAGVPLLDVAYDPWPTPLGAAGSAAGGVLLHGLDCSSSRRCCRCGSSPTRRPGRAAARRRTGCGRRCALRSAAGTWWAPQERRGPAATAKRRRAALRGRI